MVDSFHRNLYPAWKNEKEPLGVDHFRTFWCMTVMIVLSKHTQVHQSEILEDAEDVLNVGTDG